MAAKLYKHFLLATDLSTHSLHIAKRAATLAKAMKAKLSVIHVLGNSPIAYAGEFSIPIDVEFEMRLQKQAEKQLEKLCSKIKISKKSQFIANGSVKTAVTGFAKKIKADLIVLGTHGHEGLNLLLGSQANAILNAAACDVWIVRIK